MSALPATYRIARVLEMRLEGIWIEEDLKNK